MRDPLVPERNVSAAESLREIAERQLHHRGTDVELLAVMARAPAHLARPRHVHRREDHVLVWHDAPRIARRRRGRDGGEMRRRAHGGVPREPPFVGVSDHSHSAIRAGQPRRPLDGIVAVAHVRVVVAEVIAVRRISAAHVLRDEDVSARGPVQPRTRKYARVRRALEHHTEWSAPDRTSDIRRQPRTVARRHPHRGVFGDGVLRIRDGTRPQLVELLDHERGRASHQSDTRAGRLARRVHRTGERVAVPGCVKRLIVSAEQHGVGAHLDVRGIEHGLARAPANRSDKARVARGEVREPHAPPSLEARCRRRALGRVRVPIARERR